MAQKPINKKEHIIKAATEHFSNYGYEATSLDNIAKACGITKPAIYYHFQDKAALYEIVLLRHFDRLNARINQGTDADDPRQALQGYIEAFGSYLIEVPTFSATLSREIANGGKGLPDSCISSLSQTLNRLSSILEKGKVEGFFVCENPFMIQMMIVTTLTAYITTRPLRERVYHHLGRPDWIDPDMTDVITSLSDKIIKALAC